MNKFIYREDSTFTDKETNRVISYSRLYTIDDNGKVYIDKLKKDVDTSDLVYMQNVSFSFNRNGQIDCIIREK